MAVKGSQDTGTFFHRYKFLPLKQATKNTSQIAHEEGEAKPAFSYEYCI